MSVAGSERKHGGVRAVKAWIPWPVKVGAKLVLSRIPVDHRVWRRVRVFELGRMEDPAYAYGVFRSHFDRTGLADRRDLVVLELGPGDSLFSGLIAYAHGAVASYLVDVGPFARHDLALYRAMANFLAWKGLRVPDMSGVGSVDRLLTACGARYETRGLESLRKVPTATVDFVWSHTVIQYVRRREFLDTMRELRRILRPDGVCSHRVDLRDSMGGALNNLRFPTWLWERDVVVRSGFYTNRLRFSEMLQLFGEAGFDSEVVRAECWEKLPMPRAKLAPEFRHLSDEELSVSGFDVVLRPC